MSNLALSFASEMEKIAIRLRGFGRANDKVWSALVGPDKAAPHYLYRQINRMRMQGLNPTQTSALREINKRYLRDVQGVAPRGMGGQSIGIPGGNEGGVLLPMANLGGKKELLPSPLGAVLAKKKSGHSSIRT